MSAQEAKTIFITKLRKKDHTQLERKDSDKPYTPTSLMVGEMCDNGIADITGGTISFQHSESSNLEMGNSKNRIGFSKSPKYE